MGKRSRAKAALAVSEVELLHDEENTKPKLRLVPPSVASPVEASPASGKQDLALQSLRLQRQPESAITAWLPFLFGGLMALGFAYVNKGPAVKSPSKLVGASPTSYTSPLLETVRSLNAKK